MSTTIREVCIGCGHLISKHFNDVTGIARCLHQSPNPWFPGESLGCACANFTDPNKEGA